jgi:hypothetical protein
MIFIHIGFTRFSKNFKNVVQNTLAFAPQLMLNPCQMIKCPRSACFLSLLCAYNSLFVTAVNYARKCVLTLAPACWKAITAPKKARMGIKQASNTTKHLLQAMLKNFLSYSLTLSKNKLECLSSEKHFA